MREGEGEKKEKNHLMCQGKKEKREKGKKGDRTGVNEGGVKDGDIQHEIIPLGC